MLDTCIQMSTVFNYFIGISTNSVCFKYPFFGPCEARYQRSSGEGSELQREEAQVQIPVVAVLFRICEKCIGDVEFGEWVVGEKGKCHSFY